MTALLRRADLDAGQRLMGQLVEQHRKLLIVATMGAGKTGAVLTACVDWLNAFEVRRVLVVAPIRVATDTWPVEIRKWEHTRFVSVAVAVGTPEVRAAALAANAEITVINFENLAWLYQQCGGAAKWPFDCVIIDESSQFKAGRQVTRTAKRKNSKGRTVVVKGGRMTRFGAMAKVRHKIRVLIEMTGTPRPKTVHNLWGPIYLLDGGQRLGKTLSAFEDQYFNKNQYTNEITAKEGAEAEITERIKDIVFSIPPPKNLPKPVFVDVPVTLSKSALQEYTRFKRTLVSELHDVEAANRAVLTMKLLQFANGSMYREDGSIAEVHTEKLKALDDLLLRADGDPMLVFYGFKFDRGRILARHPDAVVLNQSKTAVEDWNAGKIRVLLAHPKSCAHGLNLQFGGHLACWFGLTWDLEYYLQANARLPRPGQKHQVAIYRILAENTDDRRILSVLDFREARQDDLYRATERAILTST